MTTQSLTLRYPMAKTQSFNFTVAMTPDISAKIYIIFEITLVCESEAQLGLEWCHKKGAKSRDTVPLSCRDVWAVDKYNISPLGPGRHIDAAYETSIYDTFCTIYQHFSDITQAWHAVSNTRTF